MSDITRVQDRKIKSKAYGIGISLSCETKESQTKHGGRTILQGLIYPGKYQTVSYAVMVK